jgi:drug/metabolite transporter (DMT)-like permease
MILAASVGYAIGGFVVKRRFGSFDPIGVVTLTMALSAALSLPVAAATAPDAVPGLGTFGAMVVLGVGGTGVAFAIFYQLIGHLGPARASLVAYVAPGFAVLYGVTLRGEPLTVWTVAGLALIVGGSWLAARNRSVREPAARAAPSEVGAAA